MIYPVAVAFLLLTVALLLAGTIGRKYTALYVLKFVWFPGLLLAVYLTLGAWKERSYSENWAAFGVLFFVLPFTGLVLPPGYRRVRSSQGQARSACEAYQNRNSGLRRTTSRLLTRRVTLHLSRVLGFVLLYKKSSATRLCDVIGPR